MRNTALSFVALGLLLSLLLNRPRFSVLLEKYLRNDASIGHCASPSYTVRTISYDPLIQHIEGFISPEEIEHLKHTVDITYQRSALGEGVSEIRNSSTAFLLDDDPVASCIRARAAEFQGFISVSMIEELQLTKYGEGQLFLDHYDWGAMRNGTVNRETTFFGIIEANCDECGTSFPLMQADWSGEDERWCRIVDCDLHHLVVRPIPGSATFWVNLLPDGSGDERLLHSGLPPRAKGGVKIGLNIWTLRYI